MTTTGAAINAAATHLAALAARFITENGEPGDVVATRVEVSRWRIVIHLRPRPMIIEQDKTL